MKSCCFTGHRSFTGDTTNLETRLYDILERAINKKVLLTFTVAVLWGGTNWLPELF